MWGDFLFIFLLVVAGFTSVAFISVNQSNEPMDSMGSIPHAFSIGNELNYVMQRLCPCNAINKPATTERQISNSDFNQLDNSNEPDERGLSAWAWIIMQFTDHDITLTHSDTDIAPNYIKFNDYINMKLVPAKYERDNANCKVGKTFISNCIDGTNIYADYRDTVRASKLRMNVNGMLKMTRLGFLPRDPESSNQFYAGDVRASEHALLTTMHTIWAREHNRLARELLIYAPGWSDERLYWKARQIVVAMCQKILYTEALPALFGNAAFQKYVINSPSLVKGDGVRITSEFSNVAFRYGHSMVSNNIGKYPLSQLFFNVDLVEKEGLENLILEAQKTSSQKVDLHVVDGLRNFLFGAHGEDLVTRNLYKARQLEVGTYQQLAVCYGFPVSQMVPNADPLRGLLSEHLMGGSSLPRGIATIVGEQFNRLMNNDPEFYLQEAAKEAIGPIYYKKILAVSFRDIVVRNTQLKVSDLPKNMFFLRSKNNK